MLAYVVLILIGYKAKGKTPLKKRRKKQIILYYCLSLISDTTLSYSLLGLAPGTGTTPFFIRLYIVSLRDAPDILMLFLSFFVLYNTITTHSRRRRREVQKWIILYLARKWKLEVLVLCFWYFFALWEELGLNITGWTEHTGRRREYRSTESSRLLSFPLFWSAPGRRMYWTRLCTVTSKLLLTGWKEDDNQQWNNSWKQHTPTSMYPSYCR